MTAIDVITLGYAGFNAWRGSRRGLADETYRLTRVVVALLAGCGLYDLLSKGIDAVLQLAPSVSDTAGFVVTFAGAFALLRVARRKLIDWVNSRVHGSVLVFGGAIAGAVRAGVVLTALMTALHISPVENNAADQSWIGKVAGVFQSDEPEKQGVEHERTD